MTEEEIRKDLERIQELSPEERQAELKKYEKPFRAFINDYMVKMFGVTQTNGDKP